MLLTVHLILVTITNMSALFIDIIWNHFLEAHGTKLLFWLKYILFKFAIEILVPPNARIGSCEKFIAAARKIDAFKSQCVYYSLQKARNRDKSDVILIAKTAFSPHLIHARFTK